ncbi:hypothetical protein MRB53_033202 [Persea americana]|uniref:Uncharacterized protein n=1 Tax=Persea americana TaxID=3435 RepID=A0ACC2KU01_PERAE|nr:hypothetical protein MRB53_033202 [Persea americana]
MGEAPAAEMIALGQVFAHATAFADTMLLKLAVQLGLADIIHAHAQQNPEGITLIGLAKSMPLDQVNINNLSRIMGCMVRMGLFSKSTTSQGQEDLFKPTHASEFILKDGKKSILPLIMPVMQEWAISPWHFLDVALDGNNKNLTPFEKKHGSKLWEAFSKQPMMGMMFYEAMKAETMALIPGVIKVCEGTFQRIGSLIDVGGATGIGASSIAAEFPHVKCSVLDRPDVVALAKFAGCPNVEFLAGDMFTSIPHADALLLKKILHDWGDEECLEILQRCKEAVPKGGTVMIVETVMDKEMDGDDAWSRVKMANDMGMMVFTGGKERTAEEWKVLLASAGFDIYKITPIMVGHSVIEAHPLP